MNHLKQKSIFDQYINQYEPVVNKTINELKNSQGKLNIPFAQFLFSIIDYYGLLFTVATTKTFNKRDKRNFLSFFASDYFPKEDRCKANFIYFIRNGVIHQIFPKACGVGTSPLNQLFFEDAGYPNQVFLNLTYLESITSTAIKKFTNDLKLNPDYIENLFQCLIESNYGFNDKTELDNEIQTSFNGDSSKILLNCI